MTVIAATTNKGKIRELEEILGGLGVKVQSAKEAGIEFAAEENGTTFEENALIKAREGASLSGRLVIADDSGLCVDCLDGRPGIYSARYAGGDASDGDRVKKLLDEIGDSKNRDAKFVCAAAAVYPDGREIVVRGEVKGKIISEARGENGFGYDPVFVPCEDGERTFAEMTDAEKNKISHRRRAFYRLCEEMKKNL